MTRAGSRNLLLHCRLREIRELKDFLGSILRSVLEADVCLCDYQLFQRSFYVKRRQELGLEANSATEASSAEEAKLRAAPRP